MGSMLKLVDGRQRQGPAVGIPLPFGTRLGQGWFDLERGVRGEPFRWTSLQWSLEGVRRDSSRPFMRVAIESNHAVPDERISILAGDLQLGEWVLAPGRGCYAVAIPE